MFRKMSLLVIYQLGIFDEKVVSNLIQKLHLEAYSRSHNYSNLPDPLNLETMERKGKKLQKIKYLENKKSFLD